MVGRREPLLVAALLAAGPALGQELLHQPTDASPPIPLAPELRAGLADPFFRIVLASGAPPETLDATIAALTAGGGGFQTFVVGEQIGRPETALPDATPKCRTTPLRRLVISFSGRQQPSGEVLDSNVFISTFLTPAGPAEAMEVMGWDSIHGTYNYYKREGEGDSWRFRNSSAQLATADQETLFGGCLACHVNGAPVMKEFSFPWNNWNSLAFPATYLDDASANPWPGATGPLLADHLASAEQLENIVRGSMQRFVDSTIAEHVTTAADGSVTVRGLRGLIDSLFMPTELNLVSSSEISGLDGGGMTQPAAGPLPIPDTFFADVAKIGDLDIATPAFTPPDRAVLPAEYAALLETFDIETECLPGRDTLFAWFGPEPSEFDRRMVNRLISKGVIDRELVAAALAVDVGQPLFSEPRAALLGHVPDEVAAPDIGALPAAVRQAVIDALNGVPAANRSDAEQEFVSLLEHDDVLAELARRVSALRDGLRADLDPADPARRKATLERLYRQLTETRAGFLESPVSASLAEFPGLFPLPPGG